MMLSVLLPVCLDATSASDSCSSDMFSQWSEQEKARAYCLVNKVAKLDQRVSCLSY